MIDKYIYLATGIAFIAIITYYNIVINNLKDEISQDNITISKLNDVIVSQDEVILSVKNVNVNNNSTVKSLRREIKSLTDRIEEIQKNNRDSASRCNKIIASLKKDNNKYGDMIVDDCKIHVSEVTDEDYIGSNINRIGL